MIAMAAIPNLLDAADQWIKLTTPHFELYTTAGEKKGREAILYFEQVRSFFLEASPSKRAPEVPVRIVAFRSESQYKPYRMNEGSLAFYASGRNRDYIVMQDISAEHYPAAIHEYTHLAVKHAGLKLPTWLNEGMADLYSTLKPKGTQALVGDLIPGRAQTLLTSKWMPLEVLASVDETSPLYNERDKAGVFYAQSWFLTHMLYLSPEYRPNFTKFMLALTNGQDMLQAFQSAYGKGVQDVFFDLNQYLKGNRFYGMLFNVKLEKSAEDPQVSEATAADSGLVLGDVLALVHKTDEARRAYDQLAKDNPGNADVQESLAYLDWRAGHMESARQHFSRAYSAGLNHAQMCLDYATLELNASPGSTQAISILRRALELKPDFVDARLQLALALSNQENFEAAVEEFRQVKKVNPDQAPQFFLAKAYADARVGNIDQARQDIESAKKWVKSPADSDRAAALARYLDELQNAKTRAAVARSSPQFRPADEDPPAPTLHRAPKPPFEVHETSPQNPFVKPGEQIDHIEGLAQRLECDGETALLHVSVGRASMVFEIPDPTRVLIKHPGEVQHDFSCGAQKPYPITVFYAAKPDLKKGTAGIVRELDF